MKKNLLDGDFDFTNEQTSRLEAVGDVEKLSNVATDEGWLDKVNGTPQNVLAKA